MQILSSPVPYFSCQFFQCTIKTLYIRYSHWWHLLRSAVRFAPSPLKRSTCVTLASTWVFSRYAGFPPQFKDGHIRLDANCEVWVWTVVCVCIAHATNRTDGWMTCCISMCWEWIHSEDLELWQHGHSSSEKKKRYAFDWEPFFPSTHNIKTSTCRNVVWIASKKEEKPARTLTLNQCFFFCPRTESLRLEISLGYHTEIHSGNDICVFMSNN